MSKSVFHLFSFALIFGSALAHASDLQCANQPQPSREIRKILSAARQDELSGRWDEALRRFEGKRELSPEEQAAKVRITVERHLTFKQDRANTVRIAEQTLERAKQACNKPAIASVQHSIGRIYYWDAFANGNFAAAKPYFLDALELRTQMADKPGMADSEFYLGLIDQMEKRPEAAMTHFRQSLAWAQDVNDKLLQSFAIRHIAGLEGDAGKLSEAERGFRESLALREQARAYFLVPFARLTLADTVEQNHGDPTAVLKMTEQAVKEAQHSNSRRALVMGEISLSQRLQKSGQKQQALEHAQSAKVAADELGDPELVKDAQDQFASVPGVLQSASKYLFVWAGDDANKSEDFLAIIDSDPDSPTYAKPVASVAVPGPGGTPHHTELFMPEGGHLLANAHESGRTVVFDLNDPQHPKILQSFGDLAGYVHPHTYIRLPNGHILATFQYQGAHHMHTNGMKPQPGGLVEFTEQGNVVRSASADDPNGKGELLIPYSLVAIPKLDRVVSTNMSMHFKQDGETRTIQIWRLHDLKLLKTIVLPPGPRGDEYKAPGEPVVSADGNSVLVHTFTCGLYEVTGLKGSDPVVRHRKTFDDNMCSVPTRIGNYWVQTLFSKHAVVVYDLRTPELKEVSRVTFNDKQKPHWVSADTTGTRIILNSGEYGEHRLYMLGFDPRSGTLRLDDRFRDPGASEPGVSMDGKAWPHGFQGDAYPHGAVLSR